MSRISSLPFLSCFFWLMLIRLKRIIALIYFKVQFTISILIIIVSLLNLMEFSIILRQEWQSGDWRRWTGECRLKYFYVKLNNNIYRNEIGLTFKLKRWGETGIKRIISNKKNITNFFFQFYFFSLFFISIFIHKK